MPTTRHESARESVHVCVCVRGCVQASGREEREVSEAEIDLFFGWHESILLKEMQRHYEAMGIRARMKQARITAGI